MESRQVDRKSWLKVPEPEQADLQVERSQWMIQTTMEAKLIDKMP